MKKRLIAFLLVLIMVLGILPVSAFAADASWRVSVQINEGHYYKFDGTDNGTNQHRSTLSVDGSRGHTFGCTFIWNPRAGGEIYAGGWQLCLTVDGTIAEQTDAYVYSRDMTGAEVNVPGEVTVEDLRRGGESGTMLNMGNYPEKDYRRAQTYTLNYYKNTTDTVTNMPEPNPQTETSSTGMVTFNIPATKPTREGYNFLGWAGKPDATEPTVKPGNTVTTTATVTKLYAVWEKKQPSTDIPEPTKTDFDDLPIKIECTTVKDGTHDAMLKYRDGNYTIVKRQDGSYFLDFSFTRSSYVSKYNETHQKHEDAYPTAALTKEIEYDSETGKWKQSSDSAPVIKVKCTPVPTSDEPTLANTDLNLIVRCVTNNAAHSERSMPLKAGTFKMIGTVQERGPLKFCTIEVETAQYVAAFDTGHPGTHTAAKTIRVELYLKKNDSTAKWTNNKSATDNVIEVTCEPKAPTADELKKLEMAVQVKCVVDASQQHTAAYGLLGECDVDYFVFEPRQEGDDWLCDISYYPERYVAEFNTTFQNLKHVQNDEKIVPVTLIWAGGSWQIKTQGRVHVTEEYTVTYTDGVKGKFFKDKVFSGLKSGDDTPTFKDPYHPGYTFAGWDPKVAETVTGNAIYTAKWTPVEPTRDDIYKALSPRSVTVTCINRFWKDGNRNMDCGQGQYGANAGIVGQEYTLKKGENAGTWVVTFPVTNFVKSFNQNPAHNLYTKDKLSWYIRWENNAWTSAPVEPGVDDLVKLTHAPTDWREVAKIATGGKSDCIHTSCVNGKTGVCDYGITVPFVNFNADVVSVKPEAGRPGSYIATFKVDRYIDTCAKACNDKNFKDAPRTHKLLTQDTVRWRLYATPEADEKIGSNVPNHVWEAEPVEVGKDDVCTVAHNWVVTFNPDNGGDTFKQNVEYEGKAIKPTPDPEKTGYTFDGWYLDEAEEQFSFDTTITSDITLKAKWNINKYTVTFNSYGGTPVPPAQEVEYGLTATKPADPTLKGYTFAFWYLGEDEQNATAYDFNTPVTENITLTAKWNINKYTVTFNSYGGTPVPPAQEVEYGLTATKPADPTLKGYTFAFWYLGEDEQNATAYDFDTPVTENITLTAKWNINKYTVTFNSYGGTPVPPAQEVEYGLTATEPAAPEKTGYTFDGWYLGDEKYDFSAAVEQNITLTAKWEKKTYKVVAKLYVNGKPAYYQNTNFYTYEVSGLYGEAIDFDTIKAKAVEQAKQIKKASASYTAVILEDHEPNPVCTTFGEHQPDQTTHYVKVNVKTEEKVVILQSFEGKTDLTTLHTTTAPYGTNVVEFLNGLGLDLDVAGYTLDTDEDGNTNWYKKDSPKWTFGANDTINGWTNVLLKYTITPHNIYAYLRTGDSIGDVLELNEATLNRLGLTKYNTEGFISIGTFVSNTLLTQDEYYGFDEDEAFLDVLAELQTKLVPETGVSLDKVGSKINWSWLYQPSDVDDRIAGYPTEDTDGYQLSGSLLLYGAKFEAGANDVTGMPTAAYGAYLDYFVSGESFNLPAAPTRPGYDFKGWKIGNAVLTAGAAYTVDEDDMVFTAQWEARTDTPYTVEHYLENLDGNYALDTTEPLKGTTDTTVTAAAKSYDNFTYDSTVPDTVASGNIAGDGSLVLKLFYTRNTYDYTVRHIKQLPDGSYDEANAEVETLSGKFEALAAVTAKDYGSHYPTNDADTKQSIKIEKGLTIDVKYDLDEHTLTFETNGGSAINPVTVRHGNAVARPADPTKDKYTFIGWYADPEFTEEYDFATVLEADKTIYAKFELTSTPIGDIYVRYDVLHIKQLPDGTYDLANAEVEHLSAKKDTTVTAVIKDYRATHHVNVNRTLSKLTGTAIQPYKGVDGKPVYTILSVYYDLDFHTLTFDTMGGSKIAPETVRHGLTVAKPKDPVNGGYIFDGWYTDKTFRTPYNFATPLTEDITIYSKWVWIVLPGTTVKKNTPKLNTADHFAYVQGYPDGTVKPTGNITRAETAAILFRLMDDTSRNNYYSTKSGFRDVAAGTWYNTYVATLNNAGVITDSANGYFRPNEAITRAELAAMLASFTETTRAANYFDDVSANHWAANAIAICAKLGWITGYPDGTFRPDRNVTRAELMAMINRATGRAPKSADAFLPGMKTWIDNTADKWYYLDVQEATNSHSYTVKDSETWTALTSDPNWSLYE